MQYDKSVEEPVVPENCLSNVAPSFCMLLKVSLLLLQHVVSDSKHYSGTDEPLEIEVESKSS